MRPSARGAIWSLVLLGCIAAIIYLLRPTPILVDTAVTTIGPLTITAREDGLTRIRERYEISTPLAGRLLRITHEVGDNVIADQTVLARMEPTLPTLLDPRSVAQAQARVRAAERRLEVARLRLETARAEAEHAETERIRLYQLSRQDAATDKELKEAELLSKLRADARRTAEYAIEIAEYELELENAALVITSGEPDEESDLTELVIRAPINGRILRIQQENSAVIPAGTVLMELGDPADLELVVDVLSRDAVKIRPGANVTLNRWGGDRPLRGQVRYVEPAGFTKFSALGVEEQRVNVVIDLIEPPEERGALGDAFRVEAEITLWHADDVLRIPTAALFRVGGRWAAFFVSDGIAEQRELEIGQINESMAEVIGGAEAGQTVIVYPGDRVQPGTRVRPR
jgi:HlyD family secretion protein